MRLSRLHIAGFKSFPDRSELGFDDGVTAIVGPNGCGKSNVVDAITWVLGEQSAKSLRGERMEDVIFNGSDIRKPTAAAEVRLKFTQVAQVVATVIPPVDELLDEQPLVTRDVEIGRRLYRSGESEYLIDGEICRLRDIHDLLMDSGLGVKAYAVIEQGKIGQILSSRPAERRMLIEEAAGVTKYKSRRRAAELKLEAAQQNLTRVDDIIFEVEKQRGALKRQAARARRYKRLREELRKWEQVQFARRYEALRAEIAAATARLDEARAREAAAAAHVASVETALETVRLAFTTAEAEATATRERAHAKELEIGRHQQQVTFDRQQIQDLTQQADGHRREVTDLEARREPAALAIEAQRVAAGQARHALDEAGQRVSAREADYAQCLASVQAAEREADDVRSALLSASTALSALHQARDHAGSVRDRIAADRERLEIEARELESEAVRSRQAHADSQRALEEARSAHGFVLARRSEVEAQLSLRRADRDRAVAALGAMERELAGKEARLRSLEELEARRSRFGDAARLLLADEAHAIGHRGAVADQLEVERSYERSVDALLGELLQYVIVERAGDVPAALSFLADRKAGRCGFVVLEAAARATAPAPPAASDLAVAAASGARALGDVVRAVGPHAAAVGRLIDAAFIADTFERARALSETVSAPVATLSGDVLRGGWLVQGGSRSDAHGILETRAEALALRADVDTARGAVEGLQNDARGLDYAIEADQLALAALVVEQHDHEKAIVGFEGQTTRTSEDCLRTERRLEVVGTERARAEEEVAAADRRREEAIAAIVTREADQRGIEERLGRILSDLQGARASAEAAMRLASDSRAEHATLTERLTAVELEVTRLVNAAHELLTRVEARREDIQRIETRCAELRESITATERALDSAVSDLDALRQAMREVDLRVIELRLEVAEREHAIRAARQALDAFRAEVMQSEVARVTATADLNHASAACLEAVGIPLDEVAGHVERMRAAGELVAPSLRQVEAIDEDEDEAGDAAAAAPAEPESVEAGVAAADGSPVNPEPVILDLRRKIDRLGPVNMMAIEQFDELESRHTFLTTQRKDLLDSIAQTGEAIRKIEKTTRERFEEAFHSINLHFEKTFTTLFGGGRAGLVLIDQENDPESGIDIIAQPPGKRLQNVQLLSGGEKALTAMALMFAVFKHRPSPFCLLDEIDAPLDDANIGRFIEMLQGMQEHTQFILITHNRKTMEIADRLYGVTMEEPGVSKLISLQLN